MNVAPKPEATPTYPGNYMSTCMVCGRTMMWADKRCRLCVDCKRPDRPGPRLMVEGDLYPQSQSFAGSPATMSRPLSGAAPDAGSTLQRASEVGK